MLAAPRQNGLLASIPDDSRQRLLLARPWPSLAEWRPLSRRPADDGAAFKRKTIWPGRPAWASVPPRGGEPVSAAVDWKPFATFYTQRLPSDSGIVITPILLPFLCHFLFLTKTTRTNQMITGGACYSSHKPSVLSSTAALKTRLLWLLKKSTFKKQYFSYKTGARQERRRGKDWRFLSNSTWFFG